MVKEGVTGVPSREVEQREVGRDADSSIVLSTDS